MQEQWKDIVGYEGFYQVSNFGQIRNSKGRILAQRKNHRGYMLIQLCKNGEQKTHLVHRLVLSTFKPNSNNKLQVNHINELKTDNRLENLEWMTSKQNCNYGNRNIKISNSEKIRVKCIELNKIFDSATDAALWLDKKYGNSKITACCRNKRKSAYNYHWKYAEEE